MLATLFALPAIAAALPAGTMDFEKFKRMFRRNYAAGEEPVRRAIFEAEMSKIEAHNAAEFSWKMGVNQYIGSPSPSKSSPDVVGTIESLIAK